MPEPTARPEVLLPSLATFQEDLVRSMAEARPDQLLSLQESGELNQHLEREEKRFMALALDLKRGGRTDQEAEEMALLQTMPDQGTEFASSRRDPLPEDQLLRILESLNLS